MLSCLSRISDQEEIHSVAFLLGQKAAEGDEDFLRSVLAKVAAVLAEIDPSDVSRRGALEALKWLAEGSMGEQESAPLVSG